MAKQRDVLMTEVEEIDPALVPQVTRRDWGRLDEFIEEAAMTTRPDAVIGDVDYALFLGEHTILSRFGELSIPDRVRLNKFEAVIYRGEKRPLYFYQKGDAIEGWNFICSKVGGSSLVDLDESPVCRPTLESHNYIV